MNGIEKLIAALGQIDLIAGPQTPMLKLSAEDIADIAWLLLYIEHKQGRQERAELQQDELAVQNTPPPPQATTPENTELRPAQKEQKPHIQLELGAIRHVYLRSQRLRLFQEPGVTLFRSPAASALPGSLDIARALRPLMRRVPSRTNFMLDELGTANCVAESQRSIWSPVLKAAPMRWLEIALVVDIGESMAPWWQTIDELRLLLEHHGAFRDVRIWRLATNVADQLYLYAGMSTDTQQERNPRELIDPTGQRLILVVTDCVSPAWHSGKAQQMLNLWGQSNIVTMVQVFPKRLWTRTALCNADTVQVRTTALNRGNAGIALRGDQDWFNEKNGDEEISRKSLLPIPIVTLEPRAIANWANMIVGTENTWSWGAVFYEGFPSVPGDGPFIEQHTFSPRDLVRQFRAVASAMASKLLSLLSAAPVSFPVIRLIQQALLPQSQQVHVAEIFLSGLLEEVSRDETTNDPDYIEYDFLPGVREVIRETVSIHDESQVIEAVSTFLGGRYGHLRDFYALATTSSIAKTGDFLLEKEIRPFARIVVGIWRHLGGVYETLADNLERCVDETNIEDIQNISSPSSLFDNTPSNLDLHSERDIKHMATVKQDKKLLPFYARLRNEREMRGWSQTDLAEKVGCDPKTIGRWERGDGIPHPYFRHLLSEVLGRTPQELGLISEATEVNIKDSKAVKNDRKSSRNIRLQKARLEFGWSQKELADRVGTTLVNISRWERGKTFPTPYFRQQLSKVLGKTPAELGLLSPSSPDARIVDIPITRNPYFTGREQLLASLNKRLSITRMTALIQPQALYGLGGVGKTQIAAEYAFRYGDEYTHVFWVLAATRDTLIADFVKLAQLLDLPEKDQQDQQRIVLAVKRWLAAHDGWLLIMDSADDLPQAKQFLPSNHKGFVLFTIRSQALGSIAASIEVEQLDLQKSSLLLLRLTHLLDINGTLDQAQPADRAAAERIVKEIEGLPLAIVQAGAYIEETGCSLDDYLSIYAANRKELLARPSQLLFEYPGTVATTWALSFEQIKQESAAATDLLCLYAFLAPDAIPEEMLTRGAAELGPILGAVVADGFKLNETLNILRRYSLVRRDRSTHMLSIHRLVQTVHRDSMDQETQSIWAERTVRAINAAFPEIDYGSSENHQYYLQYYLPHIQGCATLIAQYDLHFPEAAHLLYRAGIFLYFHGFYPQSQSLHQQALVISKQVLGPDHPAVAESLNALALLSRLQGNYSQAEELHIQALAMREKMLGPDHPAAAESLNNLGVLYRSQGKYEQAEPLLWQALSIREKTLGSEHPDTLYTFVNLAKLYSEQHKYEQAEQLLQRVVATGERVLEPEHPLIAQALNLLARLSYGQGNYEQAETLWKRSLSIGEKTFGLEHPATAEGLNDLAELYYAQGRYTEAQSFCQQALSICEKILGPEHPDTISYRKHLTKILSKVEME